MSVVITSKQLLQGQTGKWDKSGVLSQPIQVIPRKEKDDIWKQQNMDWWEHLGVLHLREKYKRLYKNYSLANGVIDKTDYIPDSAQNAYGDMINILSKETDTPYEIKFYPLIPTIINVLTGEFAKRNNTTIVKSIDEYAINDMLEKKKEMITQYVVKKTQEKIALKMAEMGIPEEQAEQQMQEAMSLPQIQEFFNKSYRSIPEQWATHELAVCEEKFKLYELETIAFRDKLTSGEEFWHVRIFDEDYEVELWSPLNTFYHKSPSISYVSEGSYVGRIHLLTVADIIDRFGPLMTEEQVRGLTDLTGSKANHGKLMGPDAMPTDWYNTTRKADMQISSVHWNQAVAMKTFFNGPYNQPLMSWLSDDGMPFNNDYLIVTEVYWKSQKKLGHLKQILDDNPMPFEDVVGEEFQVTVKPEYDLTVTKQKTKDNLIYGQHIDWFWVNEVWQGIKIGLSFINSWAGMSDNFEPIYLDVKPLPFQLKSDTSLYNAKLPVEGFLGYNRNVKKTCLVDQMKPHQIGYNMVNNQIYDMLIDEIGNVVLLDQNMIPKNSMDGSWGKHNFTKAYQVMKNFGILPVDSSITNTDVPVNFGQTSVVNLEKTNQLMSRIQISEYFKNECFSAVGITPQRLGQITSSESATGVQYSVNNSYAQTEMYFVEHATYLMPRVKEMILNVAQYVNSNKKDVKISYINREEENAYFEIEGTKLLLSDLKIYVTSKPEQKAILDQLKQLAAQNNTSTATIFDLAKIMQSSSVTDILQTLKKSVDTAQEQQDKQMQSDQANVQAQIQAQQAEQESQRAFEAEQKALDRETDRYIAEVRSVGFGKDQDVDGNQVPDALEVAKFNSDLVVSEEELNFKRDQELNNKSAKQKDQLLKEKELNLKTKALKADIKAKEAKIKLDRENQKNDLQIEKLRIRNKPKPKK